MSDDEGQFVECVGDTEGRTDIGPENGADTSMGSAWFLSDTTGFALLTNGNRQATQLIETLDGGMTWNVVHSWPWRTPG